MTARVHILVKGRVQGVGFRFTCRQLARRLGLYGWVKNLPDGSVEIVAEGPPDILNQMLTWSRQGPAGAYVTDWQANPQPPSGSLDTFDIHF